MSGFYILETCADSMQSVQNACMGNTHRIELCENLCIGGTTPSYGLQKMARSQTHLPIYVLIRPRCGDFRYSDIEIKQMKEDIRIAKELGADGIVSGILSTNGSVDVEHTAELVALARPLSFTFHRAFDFTPDPLHALADVIRTGADRILTSGQQNRAVDAIPLLKTLVAHSQGRIIIMPGGGITPTTLPALMETGACEFHASSAINADGEMAYRPTTPSLCISHIEPYQRQYTQPNLVKQMVEMLNT